MLSNLHHGATTALFRLLLYHRSLTTEHQYTAKILARGTRAVPTRIIAFLVECFARRRRIRPNREDQWYRCGARRGRAVDPFRSRRRILPRPWSFGRRRIVVLAAAGAAAGERRPPRPFCERRG